MKRSDAFPTKYISSADIGDREIKVVIDQVVEEALKDDEGNIQKKPVAYFRNGTKGLVLNQTNWDEIEHVYGDESDDWAGKPITIYVDHRVKFGNKIVKGIRVKIAPTAKTPVAQKITSGRQLVDAETENPAADMDDEIPF